MSPSPGPVLENRFPPPSAFSSARRLDFASPVRGSQGKLKSGVRPGSSEPQHSATSSMTSSAAPDLVVITEQSETTPDKASVASRDSSSTEGPVVSFERQLSWADRVRGKTNAEERESPAKKGDEAKPQEPVQEPEKPSKASEPSQKRRTSSTKGTEATHGNGRVQETGKEGRGHSTSQRSRHEQEKQVIADDQQLTASKVPEHQSPSRPEQLITSNEGSDEKRDEQILSSGSDQSALPRADARDAESSSEVMSSRDDDSTMVSSRDDDSKMMSLRDVDNSTMMSLEPDQSQRTDHNREDSEQTSDDQTVSVDAAHIDSHSDAGEMVEVDHPGSEGNDHGHGVADGDVTEAYSVADGNDCANGYEAADSYHDASDDDDVPLDGEIGMGEHLPSLLHFSDEEPVALLASDSSSLDGHDSMEESVQVRATLTMCILRFR